MAQRYLLALDYADLNAKRILKKHAKKRPLGEIEIKHRYTPAQPVLSCRTVDIDVSGTRTYRPKSTTDIIQEQHRLIHSLYTNRTVTSAPVRREKPVRNKSGVRKAQRINIEVTGQTLTSQSHSNLLLPRKKSALRKPKLNVRAKSAPSGKVTFQEDHELLLTSRSTKALTNRIHEYWQPENHNLNTGTFVRGQTKAEAPPSLDTWLTFGGAAAAGETSGGIIDAFAQVQDRSDFYSVEGGVGSRIAHQLQKGDRIRIGINGQTQSHDLRIKQRKKTNHELVKDENEKEKAEKVVIPLCWQDQVTHPSAKVISPRSQRDDGPRPSLCETHPVIFNHEDENKSRPKLASPSHEGYKVRQRPKSGPGLDGQDQQNKIVVLSIDQNSGEDEDRLQSLTVDDVLKHSISTKNIVKEEHTEKDSLTNQSDRGLDSASPQVDSLSEPQETMRSTSKASIADSHISSGSDRSRTPKFKAMTPTFTVQPFGSSDLSVGPPTGSFIRSSSDMGPRSTTPARAGSEKSGPGSRPGSDRSRPGSDRSRPGSDKSSVKHMYKPAPSKPIRVSSPASFTVFGSKGETEFIQISTQIRNPNPQLVVQANQKQIQDNYISQNASEEAIRKVTKQNKMEDTTRATPRVTPAPASSPEPSENIETQQVPTATTLAINIPTAEDFSDRDSMINSPWPSQRHDNKDVEKITTLMEDTVVEREVSQKSVKFKVDE